VNGTKKKGRVRLAAAFLLATVGVGMGGAAPGREQTADQNATPASSQPADVSREAVEAKPSASTPYNKPFVIPIRDEINDVTLKSLERRIDRAVDSGADLIIFDIDTPGGVVYTTLEICTKIKNLRDVHTVAWINPRAFSAGAIISLACNEIAMSGRSTIGDSQPIMIGAGGATGLPEDIEAKMTSPLVEEVRDSARRNGYDLNLCMAMIHPEMEIFWVRNTETGEQDFVDRAGRDDLFGIAPTDAPRRIRKKDAGEEEATVTKRTVYKPGQRVSDSMSQTAWRYVKSVPGLNDIQQPIVSGRLLLTMTQDEAVAFGFARGILNTLDDFRKLYPIDGAFETLDYTWSEHLVAFLSNPLVRGVLFILIMMGAYTEFKSPGLGVPGLVAIVALAVFLGAPYLTGLASIADIIILFAGVALVLVEIFLIPGFGIAGIMGMLLIVAGLLMSFMPAEAPGPMPWPTFNYRYTLQGLKWGMTVLAGGLFASLVLMALLSKFMPRMPYLGRVVAANPTAADVAPDIVHPFEARVGDEGTAVSQLRPAGKARFGSALVDVVTEGEFVEPNTPVRVVERRGNRVVVRSIA
jgi:membrane-bound serine protease (ClpP class)